MSWSSFYIYSSPPLSSSLRLSSPEHENDANREERGGRGGAHHGQRSTSAQVKGGGWRWRERWKPAVHRTCASLWFSSQSSTGRRWGAPPPPLIQASHRHRRRRRPTMRGGINCAAAPLRPTAPAFFLLLLPSPGWALGQWRVTHRTCFLP